MAETKRQVHERKRANGGLAEADVDTIIGLVEAAMGADYSALRRAGSQLVRRFSEEGHADYAARLRGLLRRRSSPLRTAGHVQELPLDGRCRLPLVDENPLPSTAILMEAETEAVVNCFVEDALYAERLSKVGSRVWACALFCAALLARVRRY